MISADRRFQAKSIFGVMMASILLAGSTFGADLTDAQKLEFFNKEIEPVLQQNCLKCHSGEEPKGELLLTSREGLLAGGESGEAVTLSDLEDSLILSAINYDDFEMPPQGKLAKSDIALITRWVKMGAPYPEGELEYEDADDHSPPQVSSETRDHWSFRPLARPAVPAVKDQTAIANPIDAFIANRREGAGLFPNPAADKVALIRRAYYDLIGLPPTPAAVAAFTGDGSPNAFAKVVDGLLDSPQYGERWARHWLDLVRYAETNSFERDNPKPFVWKYRDYVIHAFNEDKPYDQFVREQLAGDEVPNPTADSLIATAYYRLGAWDDEPADPELARFDELDDIVGTTSQVFLGLTVNCARCHDHKLDPIPQKDYYQMVAFFRNITRYGQRSDQSVREASVGPVKPGAAAKQMAAAARSHQEQLAQVQREIRGIEKRVEKTLQGVAKDDFASDAYRVRVIQENLGEAIQQPLLNRYIALRTERDELNKSRPKQLEMTLLVKESSPQVPATHLLIRGNPHARGDVVEPGFLSILDPPEPQIKATSIGTSGRRLAFARWIADEKNPLTARVMVNRLWHFHFGRGLVRSTNNLGLQGDAPTHPELIDWLASELTAGDWKLKRMHRLMMLSNTYRMASATNESGSAIDPANDLYWKFDQRRLEAEEVRDSILAVNGGLNSKMFGPSIYPTIPPEVLAGQSRPGAGWPTSPPEEQRRRSVYIHIKRSLPVPIIKSFDGADTDQSCPVRFSTTQPTQALGMLNSTFVNEQAAAFAASIQKAAGDDTVKQVTLTLTRVTQRQPTKDDVERGLRLIKELQEQHQVTKANALKYFCLVALNLNEFVFLD